MGNNKDNINKIVDSIIENADNKNAEIIEQLNDTLAILVKGKK